MTFETRERMKDALAGLEALPEATERQRGTISNMRRMLGRQPEPAKPRAAYQTPVARRLEQWRSRKP